MENRKFKIYIKETIEWWITTEDYNYKLQETYKPIGIFGQDGLEDNKIIYLFDIVPRDKYIDEAKKDPRFYEVCNFEDIETNHKFTGTFIDALNYIKKVFKYN